GCLAAAYAGLTQISGSLWSLYAGYLLLPVLGAGTQMVTWTQLVSLWFLKNRGLALALVLTGTGLCTLLVTPLIARVIEAAGWQTAFWCLAALPLLVTLPLVYFLMPERAPAAETNTECGVEPAPPLPALSYR